MTELERKQAAIIEEQAQKICLLEQKIDLLVRQIYGSKSEKLDPGQLELLLKEDPEPELKKDGAPAAPSLEEGGDEAGAGSKRRNRGPRPPRIPEHLPVVEEVIGFPINDLSLNAQVDSPINDLSLNAPQVDSPINDLSLNAPCPLMPHGVSHRRISFKGVIQVLEECRGGFERASGKPRLEAAEKENLLMRISEREVAERPGRNEPRKKKLRPKSYGWLQKPRHAYFEHYRNEIPPRKILDEAA